MSNLHRIYDFQLVSLMTGAAIRTAGGTCYVAALGAGNKVVLSDPDNGYVALTNPIALTNGRIRFATLKAVESVDLYIQAPGGHFIVFDGAASGATPEIRVDTNQLDQVYVIPFDIADTTAATETDTGFDLPVNAYVKAMGAGVIVDVVDATETIDVGLLASESGGDANGFITLGDVAVAGFIKGTLLGTGTTLGVLLTVDESAGDLVPEGHRGDGIAESISYTLTAGTDTAVGKIVLPVQLANIESGGRGIWLSPGHVGPGLPPHERIDRMTNDYVDECRVYDMNQTGDQPRVHEIDGRHYALISRGEGTPVPQEHAMRFLRDPAFVVIDANGQQMKLQAPPRKNAEFKLPANQTIANLDELTSGALLVRAKSLPGSEGMNKNTGKKRLVAFVMAGGVPVDLVAEPLDPDTAVLIEGDDNDDDDGDTSTADAALEHESFPEI